MSFSSILANIHCSRYDNRRDAGLTTPEDIMRDDNILYGTDTKWQLLDVYRPKQYEGKRPVIVSVHGGGWVYGTKKTYSFYCMSLAQRGFAVINFTYRLAPAFCHPCALEDTNLVFEWVLKHADEYNLDTDNIFAVGDSSGAQCLALYACILTNPEYSTKYPFKAPEDLRIKALALNCGIYNAELTKSVKELRDYLPKGRETEVLHDLTVIHHVSENFPPSFVMTSNMDFLRLEPGYLTEVFDRLGVSYISKEYGDDSHKLYHVFHCDIRSEEAIKANDEETEYFRSFINNN